jgi:CheY-like chemotaxis protein
VTRLLKSNERTRHIPIIALTAHALVTDRDTALDAGCDDYDTKPIDFDRLDQKIEGWLTVKK